MKTFQRFLLGTAWMLLVFGAPVTVNAVGESDPRAARSDGMLTWNTFLGDNANEIGRDIARDGNGNVFVVGISGATWGNPVRPFTGFNDEAFVAKLDANGNLVWHSFFGSTGIDHGTGIALDGNGNVYISGNSTNTWGTPVRAFTGTNGDGFVAKINANGELVWHTFLGGTGVDYAEEIAVDGNGNVHAVGISGAEWGTPVRAFGGSNDDAFAVKLDANGTVTWNTFLGSDGTDYGDAVALDGTGTVYVTGISTATWGSPVHGFTGFNEDAFAAKLDSAGALAWHTFLGGNGVDWGKDIAVDGIGSVYLAGISGQTWGSPVRAFSSGGNDEAFVVKLDSAGTLTWNTFLGGTNIDHGNGIAVTGSGEVYVTGNSTGAWGTPVRSFSGFDVNAFAAKLDTAGALIGNTFLGGIWADIGEGIAVDGNGEVFVAGGSAGTWGSPVRAHNSISSDAFVAKLPAITDCAHAPETPLLAAPTNMAKVKGKRAVLDWGDTACTRFYQLVVRDGSPKGPKLWSWTTYESNATTGNLVKGKTYYWRVTAKNEDGKSPSLWSSFKAK